MPDTRYTASCLLFALKSIISRGYRGGGFPTFFGISREEGGYRVLAKMESPKGWGYGYFLELHICKFSNINNKSFYNKQLQTLSKLQQLLYLSGDLSPFSEVYP